MEIGRRNRHKKLKKKGQTICDVSRTPLKKYEERKKKTVGRYIIQVDLFSHPMDF
jgi:hypothetical protein